MPYIEGGLYKHVLFTTRYPYTGLVGSYIEEFSIICLLFKTCSQYTGLIRASRAGEATNVFYKCVLFKSIYRADQIQQSRRSGCRCLLGHRMCSLTTERVLYSVYVISQLPSARDALNE